MAARKTTDEQRIEIVEKYKTGNYTYAMLGREYNLRGGSVAKLLKYRKIDTIVDKNLYRHFTINEHYFDVIDTEDKAYFLGLLYADGYNNEKRGMVSLKLQCEDKHILDSFNGCVESNRPLGFINRSKDNIKWKDCYCLTVQSRIFSQALAKLGCFQKKSLTLKFPTEEQVPTNLLRHFLRGYIDGDGTILTTFHVTNSRIQVKLVSTVDFCESLKELLYNRFDINCLIYRPLTSIERDTSTRIISLNSKPSCINFLDWIYKDSTIFLTRKYVKYLECQQIYTDSPRLQQRNLRKELSNE